MRLLPKTSSTPKEFLVGYYNGAENFRHRNNEEDLNKNSPCGYSAMPKEKRKKKKKVHYAEILADDLENGVIASGPLKNPVSPKITILSLERG
jgi:hypothetical protein